MKIRYARTRLKAQLRSALFMSGGGAIIFITSLLLNSASELDSIGAGICGAGIFSLLISWYEHKQQYLTIKDGFIRKNHLFGSKLKLSEIVSIKKFAGDYTLMTSSRKMNINTQITDPKSLEELDQTLEKYVLSKRDKVLSGEKPG